MGLFFRKARGRVVFANEDRLVGFLRKAARENSGPICEARDENGFFGKIYSSSAFWGFLFRRAASDESPKVRWAECDWGPDLRTSLDLAERACRGAFCAYSSCGSLGGAVGRTRKYDFGRSRDRAEPRNDLGSGKKEGVTYRE